METSSTLWWQSDPLTEPPRITFIFFLWLTCIQPFFLMHIFKSQTYISLIFCFTYHCLLQNRQSGNQGRGVCVCVCVCVCLCVCMCACYVQFYHLCVFVYPAAQSSYSAVPTPQRSLTLPFYNQTHTPPDTPSLSPFLILLTCLGECSTGMLTCIFNLTCLKPNS